MNLNAISTDPFLPLWSISLAGALLAAAVLAQYFILRKRLGSRRSLIISLLRLGSLLLLTCFALNPSMTSRTRRIVPPSIAVIIDTSLTMSLPGRERKASRLEEAKALLLNGQPSLLGMLGERFDVRIYALGESLKRLSVGDLPGLSADAKSLDLVGGLNALAGTHAAALVLSDGSLEDWHGEQGAGPLPLVTLPLGDPTTYKDLTITAVKIPPMAFRGRVVEINATIRSRGYGDLTIPVLLKDGARLLAAKSLHIPQGAGDGTVSLSFTPDNVGSPVLSLSIPLQPGEAISSNNRIDVPLKVFRDKTRVLMVTGSPGLNYRFMRMALKDDPTIDLLSFVVLRTPLNTINVPVQEQSLVPFPVDTVFLQELGSFDLLLFDNFPFHFYLSPKHMEKIRDFVAGGGGLALVGGADLSDNKNLNASPLGDILPVGIPDDEDYSRSGQTPVRLTKAGTFHPLTRLEPDNNRNEKLWQELAPLDGFNLLKPKSTGITLLETAKGFPILTAGTHSKGRVLVLATDYAWKWGMGTVAQGSDNRAYVRLVERIIHWLIKDPGLDPVAITAQEGFTETGKEAQVRLTVREGSGSPADKALVLNVFGPEGGPVRSTVRAAGKPGEFIGSFPAGKEGVYRVKVETRAGSVEEWVTVRGALADLDAFPDHQSLKRMSEATGGTLLSGKDDLAQALEARTRESRRVFTEEKRVPLWGTPYAIILVLLLLGLEWYERRRWGLS